MIGIGRSSFLSDMPSAASAACGILLVLTLAAAAQNAPSAPPPASEAKPPAAYQPGMLDRFGRWFKDSFGFVSSGVEGARDTMSGIGERAGGAAKDAANAAKNAASNAATAAKDAAARLPGTRVVDGRERCDIAPNGAPDCRHAAEAMCRAKGFGAGSSLDIQTAKDCPAMAYIRRETRDCKVTSFVVRAVCQ